MSNQNPNPAIGKMKVWLKSLGKVAGFPFKWSWRYVDKHHAALGVVIAFVAAYGAIWAVKKQNEISRELATQQNFFQFYAQWESEGMQERRARLAAELLKSPIPENIDDSPLVFLETLSNATKRGLLDRELVWTTFYVDVTSYWAAAKPYAQQARLREQCPCFFEELEALSKQFTDEEARRRGQNATLIGQNPESVRRFLELEQRRRLPEEKPDEAKERSLPTNLPSPK